MNPFTERGRITEPRRFIGRWRELSVIFDRLAMGRPVLVTGVAGIGKSSLLTHIAQSAAVNLERPDLAAYYIDLSVLEEPEECYQLMTRAMSSTGTSAAAVDVALAELDDPVVFCLDHAESAIAAGWGTTLLEKLARTARSSLVMRRVGSFPPGLAASPETDYRPALPEQAGGEYLFHIVVSVAGRAPALNEPYAVVGLGAFATTEMRLLTDAYLGDTGIRFTSEDIHELIQLSVGHPAYLQRAAFHLFRAYTKEGYDWRAAYLSEAQDRPVPGAPLPPAVFEGGEGESVESFFGYQPGSGPGRHVEPLEMTDLRDFLPVLLLLIAALLAWQLSDMWLMGILTLLFGSALLVLVRRLRR